MTKAIQTIALLMALLAQCPASVAADEPEGQNAAPLYEAIWDGYLDNSEIWRGLNEDRMTLFDDQWEPGQYITQELANKDRMTGIIAATQADYCDFETDYSQGPVLVPPHARTLYSCQILLIAEARLLIDAGEIDEAIARMSIAMAVAEQSWPDQHLQAVRLRQRTTSLCYLFLEIIPRNEWNQQRASIVLDSLAWIEGPDPFGLRSTLEHDRDIMALWMRKSLEDIKSDRKNVGILLKTTAEHSRKRGVIVEADDAGAAISVYQNGGFERCIEQYEQIMTMIITSLDEPDYEARLIYLNDKVRKNDFGPFARAFVPPVHSIRLQEELLAESIDDLRVNFQRITEPMIVN